MPPASLETPIVQTSPFVQEETVTRRLSARQALFLMIALLFIPLLACEFSVSTASITNAVMSRDVKGDNFEPVGITDTYPPDQGKFHAVVSISSAPSDTKVKAVWTAVDVGAAAAPNTKIDETEVEAEGTRNIDFSLTPNAGRWPPGSYQVDIYLNDKLNRTLKFTVAGAPAVPTTPPTPIPPTKASLATAAPTRTVGVGSTPSAKGTCPPLPPAATKPSGFVSNVTMALGTQGAAKDPINPTTVFTPDAVFHAVVAIKNAPANTVFEAGWFANDVGDAASCNTPIDSTELKTDGSRNLDFDLTPSTRWPAGTYRVEIRVNGTLDRVVNFSVGAGPATAPTSTRSAASPTKPPATTAPTAAPVTQCGTIPAGMGGLLVVNYYGKEMNYEIGGKLYKIPGNSREVIILTPGNQNYSADIPGVGRAGATLAIEANKCLVQSWADK